MSVVALPSRVAAAWRLRRRRALLVLWPALALSLLLALVLGSVELQAQAMAFSIARAFSGLHDDTLAGIVLGLRLPRALVAAAVGGMLALSGALLQSLLRNPLADPYVLGVSGGASCAATSAIALGLGATAIALSSAAGALVALLLLLAIARRSLLGRGLEEGEGGGSSVLLGGVMIGSLCFAALGVGLALAPDGALRPIVFWLLGDLGGSTRLDTASAALLCWLALYLVARADARAIDLLQRGELEAFAKGVNTRAVQRRQVAVSAVATGIAVSLAGAIGFVGFVAPHLVRHRLGSDPRVVLPVATLLGACLVVLADTAARTVAPPLELPVGAVTALLGAPVFLWQLQRR